MEKASKPQKYSRSSSKKSSSSKDSKKKQEYKLCPIHNEKWKFFDEERQRLLCKKWDVKTITYSVKEAYSRRFMNLNNSVGIPLYIKRDKLLSQKQRLEFKKDELKRSWAMIARDFKNEVKQIEKLIDEKFKSRIAFVKAKKKQVKRDTKGIKKLVKIIDEDEPAKFLIETKDFEDKVEDVLAKPVVPEADVPTPVDMMNDYDESKQGYRFSPEKYAQRAENEIAEIWKDNTLKDYAGEQDMMTEAKAEIGEWMRLTDQCMDKLKKYQMQCAFCNVDLNEDSINSDCFKNVGNARDQKYNYGSSSGNSWGSNTQQQSYTNTFSRATENTFSTESNSNSRKNAPELVIACPENIRGRRRHYFQPKKTDQNVLKILKMNCPNLDLVLRDLDPQNQGHAEPEPFSEAMKKKGKLLDWQVRLLCQVYDNFGKINYKDLINDSRNEGYVVEALRERSHLIRERIQQPKGKGNVTIEEFKEMLTQVGITGTELDMTTRISQLVMLENIPFDNFLNRI